jgi:hypothetical protein
LSVGNINRKLMREYLNTLPYNCNLNEEEKNVIVYIPSDLYCIKYQLYTALYFTDKTYNITVDYE